MIRQAVEAGVDHIIGDLMQYSSFRLMWELMSPDARRYTKDHYVSEIMEKLRPVLEEMDIHV